MSCRFRGRGHYSFPTVVCLPFSALTCKPARRSHVARQRPKKRPSEQDASSARSAIVCRTSQEERHIERSHAYCSRTCPNLAGNWQQQAFNSSSRKHTVRRSSSGILASASILQYPRSISKSALAGIFPSKTHDHSHYMLDYTQVEHFFLTAPTKASSSCGAGCH